MNYKRIIACGACLFVAVIVKGELPATITTADGQTYEGVSLVRTEPDGFIVNYQPTKNGSGIAKIKFSRLSPEQQKLGGYDPETAKNFEANVAKAQDDAAKASAQFSDAASKERIAREVRDAQQDQAMSRMMQTGAKRANVNGTSTANTGVANTTWTYWGGAQLYLVPRVHGPEQPKPANSKIIQDQRATAAAAAAGNPTVPAARAAAPASSSGSRRR